MRINRTNYEVFFLDYFEGNLAPDLVEELMAFLEAEPELKAEFDEFEMVSLQGTDQLAFEGKASLRRGEVTTHNYEWYFAAFAENDLKPEELAAVESFVASNPQMQRELQLMLKTRLQPNENIVFPGREGLKRQKIVPLYGKILRYGAAAAVILFMATVFFVRTPRYDTPEFAGLTVSPEQPQPITANRAEPAVTAVADPGPEIRVQPEATASVAPSDQSAQPVQTSYALAGLQPTLPATRLHARPARGVAAQPVPEAKLEQRSEFAYWHLRNREGEYAEETETQAVSLFQLAYDGIQRNLPEDIKRVEKQIAENRPFSLFGLAGASVVGLNNLLGSPVNVESERNEEGRLVQLAVGNAFEINRK